MRRCTVAAVAAAIVLLALPAGAHRLSPAYFGLAETAPGVFEARFKVSISGGLADVLSPQIPETCRISAPVRGYTVDDARVQIGAIDCGETGLRGAELAVAGLERTDTDVLLHIDWLDGSAFTHRLVPDAPAVAIAERAGVGAVAGTYFVIGVEHILLGVDHLLFVLALLMLVEGLGRLVATITAFTVAHSITLGAATLGIVSVPSAPVEATIALSILFLATELARRRRAAKRAVPRFPAADSDPAMRAEYGNSTASSGAPAARSGGSTRSAGGGGDLAVRFPWLVAFTFGLLHGFGFAGALGEVGLPEAAIPLALLFFNVGVEAGQLLFVAAFVAVAALVGRASVPVPRALEPGTIYAIGGISAFWVLERTVAGLA